MSRTEKPRHWLHCSNRFHGERWTAERIVPRNAGENEPRIPRLCVAESVAQCFAARIFKGDVFVYRTVEPAVGLTPRGVHDSLLTWERWLSPPVRLDLRLVIPSRIVDRASGPSIRLLNQRIEERDLGRPFRPFSALDRLKQFSDAVDALDPDLSTKTDRQFVAMAIRHFSTRRPT